MKDIKIKSISKSPKPKRALVIDPEAKVDKNAPW